MMLVLDACAIIAYIRDEPGAQVVEQFVDDAGNVCVVHAVNLCEVYYDCLKVADEATAQAVLGDLNAAGVVTISDMDASLWQQAARLKARIRRISLADCFALALAQHVRGSLVTSDHREFDPIAQSGLCDIVFIR